MEVFVHQLPGVGLNILEIMTPRGSWEVTRVYIFTYFLLSQLDTDSMPWMGRGMDATKCHVL